MCPAAPSRLRIYTPAGGAAPGPVASGPAVSRRRVRARQPGHPRVDCALLLRARQARWWSAWTTGWRPSTASPRRSRIRTQRSSGSPTHAGELGVDPGRIAVAGDSAGGNLATVMCLLSKARGGPRIAAQALLYPVVDFRSHDLYASHQQFGDGSYFLSVKDMDWFRDALLRRRRRRSREPTASPITATDLSGLPPALVATAGCDPLRDEGPGVRGPAGRGRCGGRLPLLRLDHSRLRLVCGRDSGGTRDAGLRGGLAPQHDAGHQKVLSMLRRFAHRIGRTGGGQMSRSRRSRHVARRGDAPRHVASPPAPCSRPPRPWARRR